MVGDYTRPNNFIDPLVERWNGRQWTMQRAQLPAGADIFLYGVSCPTATYCSAVGREPTPVTSPAEAIRTVAEQWSGGVWKIENTPMQGDRSEGNLSALYDVSCVSATDCTAVGGYTGNSEPEPLAYAWNGTKWANQTPAPPTASEQLFGVSCLATGGCMATGFSGYSTTIPSKFKTLAEHHS